jgi:hypothetical protein
MNTVIVLVLLLGFSICVVVGLVTVLQSLINQDPIDVAPQGAIVPEQASSTNP